jgi:hypothetical protein
MITSNVGNIDRVIRMISGAALGVAAYVTGGAAAIILGIAGVVAFATGLLGWCGVYTLFGINTCKIDKP